MTFPAFESVRYDSVDSSAEESHGVEVRRWDTGELAKAERTAEGFIRAPARITRCGVFPYRGPNGQTIRELRPPEVVFSEANLKSFSHLTLTNDHPPEMLTPKTAKQHATGSVANARRDGDFMIADVLITDEAAIADAERGKTRLSCGYVARVISAPGVWKDAAGVEHAFDTVQIGGRGNHLAQVWNGRAGEEVRFRMDAADAVDENHPNPKPLEEKMSTKKIKIGDNEFEVPVAAADAFLKRLDEMNAEVAVLKAASVPRNDSTDASLRKEVEQLKGELAATKADLKTRMDAEDEAIKRNGRVQTRKEEIEFYHSASALLKKPVSELITQDQIDIMRQVVKLESPKLSLDGVSEDFLRGAFRAASANRVDSAAVLNSIVGAGRDATPPPADRSDKRKKQQEARAKMLEDYKVKAAT